jgi:hypothetical protein
MIENNYKNLAESLLSIPLEERAALLEEHGISREELRAAARRRNRRVAKEVHEKRIKDLSENLVERVERNPCCDKLGLPGKSIRVIFREKQVPVALLFPPLSTRKGV